MKTLMKRMFASGLGQNLRRPVQLFLALLAAWPATLSAQSNSITVINHSFEKSQVPDGQTWGVTGWTISGGQKAWGVNNPTDTSYRGTTGEGKLPPPADGKQLLACWNDGSREENLEVFQILSEKYRSDSIYKLNVVASAPLGNSFVGAKIELWAGESIIADASLPYDGVARGEFREVSAQSTRGKAAAEAGKPLKIVIRSVSANGSSGRSDFDHVRLDKLDQNAK